VKKESIGYIAEQNCQKNHHKNINNGISYYGIDAKIPVHEHKQNIPDSIS
jgi:hypothetical protein